MGWTWRKWGMRADRNPWPNMPARGDNVLHSDGVLGEAFARLKRAEEPWSGIPAMQLRSLVKEQASELLEEYLTQDTMWKAAGVVFEGRAGTTEQDRTGGAAGWGIGQFARCHGWWSMRRGSQGVAQ